jgi:hypothetical protein
LSAKEVKVKKLQAGINSHSNHFRSYLPEPLRFGSYLPKHSDGKKIRFLGDWEQCGRPKEQHIYKKKSLLGLQITIFGKQESELDQNCNNV